MTIHVSKAPHMRFSFDDVTVSEIRIRDINEANRETRDTRIIALPRGQYTDPHNLRETGLKWQLIQLSLKTIWPQARAFQIVSLFCTFPLNIGFLKVIL